LRRDRESAHHFQGAGSVVGANGHSTAQFGVDAGRFEDVGEIEHIRITSRRCQRYHRLVPNLLRRNRHDLSFRVSKGGEGSTEDAPGVEARGVVDPFHLVHRRVTVEDHR
jgi:hypothetical protein